MVTTGIVRNIRRLETIETMKCFQGPKMGRFHGPNLVFQPRAILHVESRGCASLQRIFDDEFPEKFAPYPSMEHQSLSAVSRDIR